MISETIPAIYTNGVFRPVDATVPFAEGTSVNSSVTPMIGADQKTWDEYFDRLNATKSIQEIVEVMKSMPYDDSEYDMERWIRESKQMMGETVPPVKDI